MAEELGSLLASTAVVKKLGHHRDKCPQLRETASQIHPKQQWVYYEIPEVDPGTTGEPVDSSWLVGASGNESVLEVQVEVQLHQFLIDSGARLSLVKPGVSQTEVRPTDTAARGITGTKLKSLGNQTIEIKLGNRTYQHEFLVTPLDVDYSGVLGLHLETFGGQGGPMLKRPNHRAEALRTQCLIYTTVIRHWSQHPSFAMGGESRDWSPRKYPQGMDTEIRRGRTREPGSRGTESRLSCFS
jgi:hypothetical protein